MIHDIKLLYLIMALFLMVIGGLLLVNHKKAVKSKLMIFALFSILCLGCYSYFGAHNNVSQYLLVQKIDSSVKQLATEPDLDLDMVLNQLGKLNKKAQQNPYALVRLATLYGELGKHDNAVASLQQALLLLPDNSDIKRELIFQTSLKDKGSLNTTTRQYASDLLINNPADFGVINLLALDDYVNAEYAQALKKWQWLMVHDENMSVASKGRIERAIDVVTTKVGNLQQEIIPLTLPDSLKVEPTDAVYISLKMVGQNIPLAAKRIPGETLAQKIFISNQDLMLPDTVIPSQSQLEIVVKIAPNGGAVNQAKMVGKSAPFMLESTQDSISIILAN